METLAEAYRTRHHTTVAHSPWANGTVEAVMCPVLAESRALLAEFGWAPRDWPHVLPIVETALNGAPLERLGKRDDNTPRCPHEVMTGIRPRRPITCILPKGKPGVQDIQHGHACNIIRIEKMQHALQRIHTEVAEKFPSSDLLRWKSRTRRLKYCLRHFLRETPFFYAKPLTEATR